jgi:hypothetical protein
MYSTIGMYNLALSRLGGNELATLSTTGDTGRLAVLCNTLFPHQRDLALASHAWGFALACKNLALYGPEPSPAGPQGASVQMEQQGREGFAFSYALPPDCIRPVRLLPASGFSAGAAPAYLVRGKALFSDSSPACLQYVRRMTDPGTWPPAFADVVTWGMAAELCTAYLNDHARQKFCLSMQREALARASAQEASSMRPRRASFEWELARI